MGKQEYENTNFLLQGDQTMSQVLLLPLKLDGVGPVDNRPSTD